MTKNIHPLYSLVTIVLLSLFVAFVLFNVLSSTGIFRFEGSIAGPYLEFGGAAAGFFGSIWFFRRWYDQMIDRYEKIILKERRTNRKLIRLLFSDISLNINNRRGAL